MMHLLRVAVTFASAKHWKGPLTYISCVQKKSPSYLVHGYQVFLFSFSLLLDVTTFFPMDSEQMRLRGE